MEDSMIDSILSPRNKARWEKLGDNTELTRLHDKFWRQAKYGDKLLNVDEDQGPFNEDDDVDSDCFVLDLGTPLIFNGNTKVWIRKEYIRVYKRCIDHLETNARVLRSLVITGQPGIGKCFYLRDITVT
jgi:hypothetical protein